MPNMISCSNYQRGKNRLVSTPTVSAPKTVYVCVCIPVQQKKNNEEGEQRPSSRLSVIHISLFVIQPHYAPIFSLSNLPCERNQ